MNERIVSVRLPFNVDFVRKRQRTPDFANFLDDNVVLIREVERQTKTTDGFPCEREILGIGSRSIRLRC